MMPAWGLARERDLVPGDRTALLGAQRDERVLDLVGGLAGARRKLGRQRPEGLTPFVGFVKEARGAREARLGHPRPGWTCPHAGQRRSPA
jgi:hypothetical protein